MKPGATGLTRILHATKYSMQGLKAAWKNEAAFRQEAILMAIMSFITFLLPVTLLEQVVMIGTLFIVVIAELMNSAIEAIVDRVGSERHELSGRAKDIGSAAVFVALMLVVVTWGMILVGKVF